MLHLITATPGSGKTFWAVSQILKLAQAGESVYTNINGCLVPGVEPLPEDYDIESLPDNSYVFIDEAQKIDKFQAVGRQPLSSDPTIKFFEVHRHRGFEIYFITQDPEFLHKHILKLIGHHVFLVRPMGSRFPAVYEWSKYQNRPDTKGAKKSADAHYTISFKKSVYQYYKSTVIDTHRFQWGKLLKLSILPIAAVIVIVYVIFFSNNHFLNTHAISDAKAMSTGEPSTQTSSSDVKSTTQNPTVSTPQLSAYDAESQRIAFISKSDTYCRAFDGNGNLMRYLSYNDCVFYSDNPMALKSADPKNIQNKQMQQPEYQTNQPVYAQPANTTYTNVRGDPLPTI